MADTKIDRVSLGPTLSDQAYLSMREGITSGQLQPGTKLTERSLAESLGISPTPVREALRLLEHERLIERDSGRTIRVADPSLAHLYELTLVEAALRGTAAHLAAERASEAECLQLFALCDEAEAIAEGPNLEARAAVLLAVTRRFHAATDAASHSESLIGLIATATAFDWAFRLKWSTSAHRGSDSLRASLNEHREIAVAIHAKDSDTSERLMRQHVLQRAHALLDVAGREAAGLRA